MPAWPARQTSCTLMISSQLSAEEANIYVYAGKSSCTRKWLLCTFKVANDGTGESHQETVKATSPVEIKHAVGHGLNDGGFLRIVPSYSMTSRFLSATAATVGAVVCEQMHICTGMLYRPAFIRRPCHIYRCIHQCKMQVNGADIYMASSTPRSGQLIMTSSSELAFTAANTRDECQETYQSPVLSSPWQA